MTVRRCPTTALAVALAFALVVAGCSSGDSDDPAVNTASAEFYRTPEDLAGHDPGEILRRERIDEEDGGETTSRWRILYRSTSLDGEPIAVSGVIDVPPGEAPAGGWPVISYAHGTTGIADTCAPSQELPAEPTSLGADQAIVVSTDYEGLGTEGRHPYLVGESEARSVIDAVRAARSMGDDVVASDRYAVLGYSQGGHAALFANQIADDWAPELELVATVAGAPVVELSTLVERLDNAEFRGLLAMMLAGLETMDSDLDVGTLLTDVAAERFDVVDEQCANAIGDAFADLEGGLVGGPITDDPAVVDLLEQNTPGAVDGAAPVLVVNGGADGLLPPALIEAGVEQLCAAGQTIERASYPDADHVAVVEASLGDAAEWVQARFEGGPVTSSCASG